jgi:hypothetical protein
MKVGSLREVPGDLASDLGGIGRAISASRPGRAYGAHPVASRIVAYLALGAIAAVAIIGVMTPPSG